MKGDRKDLAAGILYTDGKRILLLKRAGDCSGNGTWCIPGGHAVHGETPRQTAERESREECGAEGGKAFESHIDDSGKPVFHTFLKEVHRPFPCMLSDEHSDYQWVEFGDVNDKELLPRFSNQWPYLLNKIKSHMMLGTGFSEWIKNIRS